MDSNQLESLAEILVPIFGAIVSVFTFITVMAWLGNKQKDREAFYKAETLRRITESSGEGAKAAIEMCGKMTGGSSLKTGKASRSPA